MSERCPKCKELYNQAERQRSSHHIIPRRLWKAVSDLRVLEVLDTFRQELCRLCHDKLEKQIKSAELEALYSEHQGMYIKTLTNFLGVSHAIPPVPVSLVGGLDPLSRWYLDSSGMVSDSMPQRKATEDA
jgi:hypothetical protein